jgi:hypothetical protein
VKECRTAGRASPLDGHGPAWTRTSLLRPTCFVRMHAPVHAPSERLRRSSARVGRRDLDVLAVAGHVQTSTRARSSPEPQSIKSRWIDTECSRGGDQCTCSKRKDDHMAHGPNPRRLGGREVRGRLEPMNAITKKGARTAADSRRVGPTPSPRPSSRSQGSVPSDSACVCVSAVIESFFWPTNCGCCPGTEQAYRYSVLSGVWTSRWMAITNVPVWGQGRPPAVDARPTVTGASVVWRAPTLVTAAPGHPGMCASARPHDR